MGAVARPDFKSASGVLPIEAVEPVCVIKGAQKNLICRIDTKCSCLFVKDLHYNHVTCVQKISGHVPCHAATVSGKGFTRYLTYLRSLEHRLLAERLGPHTCHTDMLRAGLLHCAHLHCIGEVQVAEEV